MSDKTKLKNISKIDYRFFSDIEFKLIDWLWEGAFAKGKVSIVAGDPGLGKSQLTLSIAAIVSSGGIWPASENSMSKSDVIILAAEDYPEDTIGPRLQAAGADLSMCIYIDSVIESANSTIRSFNIKKDIHYLAKIIEQLRNHSIAISLVIIDSITAYLGDNSHDNSEVRRILSPLSDFAIKFQVAIVCISHLNKNENSAALLRISGSVAFVATARSAFLVLRDNKDKERLSFIPFKNNLARDQTGFSFKIEPIQLDGGIHTSRMDWDDETVSKTVSEVRGGNQNMTKKSAETGAIEYLQDILANGGIAGH